MLAIYIPMRIDLIRKRDYVLERHACINRDTLDWLGFIAVHEQRNAAGGTRLPRRRRNTRAQASRTRKLIQLHRIGVAPKQHVAINANIWVF